MKDTMMTAATERRWFALVLLVTFAAYAPSLSNGYAMDDRLIAMDTLGNGEKNPMIHEWRPVGDYFRAHYWKGNAETGNLYRPFTVWSYAVVHHLFKPAVPDPGDREQKATAFAQHLLNVLAHLAAMVVVRGLLRGLRVPAGATLLGVLVFGLHAVHSEVVSTVVGRAELFGFVFGGGAVWLLFRDRPGSNTRLLLVAPAGALLFFLAFTSKENAAGWIGFVVVYGLAFHWCRWPRKPWLKPAALRTAVPLGVAAVPFGVYLWLRWLVLHELSPTPLLYVVNPLGHVDDFERILTAVFVWGHKGLGLTLAPFDLACDYGSTVFPIITEVHDPRFFLSALMLITVFAGGVLGARRRPLIFVAASVFLGFSFITSNVPFTVGTIFAGRLYYTPSLGLAVLTAWAFQRSRKRSRVRQMLTVGLFAWLGASTMVILERHRVWNSDEDLFLTEVERQPHSARLRVCSAGIHADRGERAPAIRHLKVAIGLDPDYALAWNNLGAIYLDQGRLDEAGECIVAGLAATHTDKKEDGFKLHCNLGLILAG